MNRFINNAGIVLAVLLGAAACSQSNATQEVTPAPQEVVQAQPTQEVPQPAANQETTAVQKGVCSVAG